MKFHARMFVLLTFASLLGNDGATSFMLIHTRIALLGLNSAMVLFIQMM